MVLDLNFGILTSRVSYSSANILAIQAQEKGVTIIGERTGGGCSTLMICSSPEWFLQYMSSFEMHSTSDFDPIAFDQGVIPDVYLDVPEVDGVPDYSSYFDIEMLGAIMDELHPVKEHSTFYDAALALIITLVFVGALLVRNRVKV